MKKKAKYFIEVNDEFTLASDNEAYGQMIERIKAVAPTSLNVMLIGSPGSGKELVAEAIHRLSQKKGPLIKVNCAALPGSLLETELFGHVMGAFTGASKKRNGNFALAQNGTLFLDEIHHMDYDQQAKLLRVVEYGEYTPIGAEKIEKTNARLVVAVNIDIGKALDEKNLRHDLYYRLANYIICIPDLRDRPEDVERIVDFYFNKVCLPRGITQLRSDCLAKLVTYPWPGNIRELRSVIESATTNAAHRGSQELEVRDLDAFPSQIANNIYNSEDPISRFVNTIYSEKATLRTVEEQFRVLILDRIRKREKGNTGRIAHVLCMKPDAVRTLYSRAGLPLGRQSKSLSYKGASEG